MAKRMNDRKARNIIHRLYKRVRRADLMAVKHSAFADGNALKLFKRSLGF